MKRIIINESQKSRLLREFNQGDFSFEVLDSFARLPEKMDYCIDTLGDYIGKGCGRATFEIGENVVLKLALANNDEGVGQNRDEFEHHSKMSQTYDIFTKVYTHADDYSWITCERVLPFNTADTMKILGIPYVDFTKKYNSPHKKTAKREYSKFTSYPTPHVNIHDYQVEDYDDLDHVNFCDFIEWAKNYDEYFPNSPQDEAYLDLVNTNPWCAEFFQYAQEIDEWDLYGNNFGLAMRNGKPWIVILDSGYTETK